jgi:hypothetical protein
MPTSVTGLDSGELASTIYPGGRLPRGPPDRITALAGTQLGGGHRGIHARRRLNIPQR